MTDFTDEAVNAKAREIILGLAADIDTLDIGTLLANDAQLKHVTGAEFGVLRKRVAAALAAATVTVTWPGTRDDADADALLEILAGAGDCGTFVEKCSGEYDQPCLFRAEDTDLPEQLLAWHRAGVQAALAAAFEADLARRDARMSGEAQVPTFECEVCTKPIVSYPCVLCEHEPAPWPGA